jgi:uncharacterized protein YjiS (DUF1127 family)
MHATNELKEPLAAVESTASVFATDVETPIVNTRRQPARNDDRCDDPPSAAVELDAWARHAQHANGFGGDAAITESSPVERRSSYALYHDARAHRDYALAEIIATAFVAIVDVARHAVERFRQWRDARATYDVLRELDDRSLRDLGLDRSELESIAAEVAGTTERTRVRAWMTSHGLAD